MSELAELQPSFTPIDAEHGAPHDHETLPKIDFDTIAAALSVTDVDLEYRDRDHYLQELRIIEINLTRLDLAKNCYDNGDYGGCRSQFEAIMDMVRPTNDTALLELLQLAHDKLYVKNAPYY